MKRTWNVYVSYLRGHSDMSLAPGWGDAAQPDREKAPRRQPEGLSNFSSAVPGYSAPRPSDQERETPGSVVGKDGSKIISNIGHLTKVIGDTVKLLKLRYGRDGAPAEHSSDIYRVVAAAEDAAAARNPKFERDLHNWSQRHLRRLSEAERIMVRSDLRAYPVEVTHRWVGEQLGLLDAERDLIDFRYAEAVDMTDVARAEKKRARDRDRKAEVRRAKGTPRRGEKLAKAKLLDPEAPAKTLYDRQQHGRKPRKPGKSVSAHSEFSSVCGGQKPPQKSEFSSVCL
ncbi:hypothetical protein [Methylobacterium phyllosphaerae]|nr:hypothetical protein [Methylobacterium phyllosphaerae]